MRRVRPLLLGLLALLLVAIVAVGIFAYSLVRRPFPQTDGTLAIAGLQDEVHVFRDGYGIPHIYAANTDDLFFAQGYVHAQDRFWQMEFWRHVSAGRLSEILGEDLVESDRFIRTMGWNRIARETTDFLAQTEPELMQVLEAYSAGVNAYIAERGDALSVNRSVLELNGSRWEIEPWTPLDTIGWGVVMSDDLSGNWSSELERASLIQALGEERAAALMPLYPYERRPVIVPTGAAGSGERGAGGETAALSASRFPLSATVDWARLNTRIAGERPGAGWLGAGDAVGSNNWVIGGAHTDTGAPLLADDPHLGIQMPSIWYEVGLHAPGWNVTGFSFAGVPGVIVGHNERIAWGVTNVGPDVQDLYIERVNPANPRQYEFEGAWRDMTVHQETIRVNGGEDVTLEVLETRHGPIISELVDGSEEVLAFQWTAAAQPSRLFKSVLALNQAQNFDQFREALRYWDVPAQNFVYADVDGNIGYQMPGLIPVRRGGNGLVPVPGWTGEAEWDGWVPYEELPYLLNPEQGYIVTANNAVVDETFPHLIELQWDNGDRAQRITELIQAELAGDGTVSAADIGRIHMDSKSLLAAAYQPAFAQLDYLNLDERMGRAFAHLRDWDGQLRRDSVAAALWEIFYMHLARATLYDELGPEAEDFLHQGTNLRLFFHGLATQPDAAWWDDTTTARTELQNDTFIRAMEETLAWFDENMGGDMEGWQWGKLHTATFVSNPLGQSGIGAIEALVNRGPYPVDGGNSAVNANGWSWENPSQVAGHVSMRMIADPGDWERSQAVLPTGQSGHPTHPHYFDMFELWQNGGFHPMLWSRERVEAAATDHLILQPRQTP